MPRPRCSWSAGPRAFEFRFTPRRAVSDHPVSRTRAVLGALPSVASSSSSPSASRSAVVRRRPLLDAVDALAAHDAAALAPMPSSLQAPSLSAAPAARLPLAQPSTPHLCVANARACVR